MIGLLEKVLNASPWGRQIKNDAVELEAQIRARQVAAPLLVAARKRVETEGLAIAKQLQAQREKIVALESAQKAALAKEYGVLHDLTSKLAALENAENQQLGAMLRTCPRSIDDFVGEMGRLDDETRRALVTTHATSGQFENRKTVCHSNQPSIVERRAAIRSARESAEALRTILLSDDELAERLDALRDTVPDGPLPVVEMK